MLGLSKGGRAFDNCGHKDIGFEYNFGGLVHRARVECPGHADALTLPMPPSKKEKLGATVDKAAKRLRRAAGKTACRACPFADMTPTQVASSQADLVEQQTRLAIGQAELARAERERARVLADVQKSLSETPADPTTAVPLATD